MSEPSTEADRRANAEALAEQIRQVRSDVLGHLAESRWSLSDLFAAAATDPFVADIRAQVALESLPGVGKVVVRRQLAELGIGAFTSVGDVNQQVVSARFGEAP